MKCIILALAWTVTSQNLPDNFKMCDHFAPNLKECVKEAVQSALFQMKDGIPEINLPPVEPLRMGNLTVEAFDNVVSFANLNIYNVYTGVVKEVDVEITRQRLKLDLVVWAEEVIGRMFYSLTGKLLMLTLDGGGNALITFRNTTIYYKIEADVVNDHGEHFFIRKSDINVEPVRIIYDLEYIVKGQKEISDEINKVINQNWEVLFDETRPQFNEIFGKVFLQYGNRVLKHIPV